jgi:hypothetical protein
LETEIAASVAARRGKAALKLLEEAVEMVVANRENQNMDGQPSNKPVAFVGGWTPNVKGRNLSARATTSTQTLLVARTNLKIGGEKLHATFLPTDYFAVGAGRGRAAFSVFCELCRNRFGAPIPPNRASISDRILRGLSQRLGTGGQL